MNFQEMEIDDLPKEWELTKLSQLAIRRRKNVNPEDLDKITYVGLEHIDSGSSILRRWGSSKDVKSSKSKFYKNDILYGKLRPYLDKAILSKKEGICSTDILVFYTTDKTIPEYFAYLVHLKKFVRYATSTMTGVNHPRTSWKSLQEFKIPLPPLTEQHNIAFILFTVQEAIEKTEAVIQATQELKKSLMDHLFTYGPVPITEREQVQLKETEIGEIPEEWEMKRVEDIAKVEYGKAKPKSKGTLPVYGSGGVYSYSNDYLFDFETIVVGRKGTAGKVFKAPPRSWASDTTYFLDWKNEENVDYLFYYMSSHQLSGDEAKTTLPSLQRPKLQNFLLPYPSMKIQNKISDILKLIDLKIEKDIQMKISSEIVLKSLLENLMTGQIRVKDLNFTNLNTVEMEL